MSLLMTEKKEATMQINIDECLQWPSTGLSALCVSYLILPALTAAYCCSCLYFADEETKVQGVKLRGQLLYN